MPVSTLTEGIAYIDAWIMVATPDIGQSRTFIDSFAVQNDGTLIYDSNIANIDHVGPIGFARNAAGALIVDFVNPIFTFVHGIGVTAAGAVCAMSENDLALLAEDGSGLLTEAGVQLYEEF